MPVSDLQKTKIDEIMSYFEFERVAIVMQALNWEWINVNNSVGIDVPNQHQIENLARNLLERTVMEYNNNNDVRTIVSTGGFTVEVEKDYIDLSFVVAECSSHPIGVPTVSKVKNIEPDKVVEEMPIYETSDSLDVEI